MENRKINREIVMLCVMSDIHGCCGKYSDMLKMIDFNNKDIMYI